MLEVGSGIGLTTMSIAGVVGARRVRGYDANSLACATALRNGKLNGLDLDIRNAAITDTGASRTPFTTARNFLASSIMEDADGHTALVGLISLRTAMAEFSPTVLVIDCEGAETAIFNGCDLSRVNTIILELHPAIIGADRCIEVLNTLSAARLSLQPGRIRETVVGLTRPQGRDLLREPDGRNALVEYFAGHAAAEGGDPFTAAQHCLSAAAKFGPLQEASLRAAFFFSLAGKFREALEIFEICRREGVPHDQEEKIAWSASHCLFMLERFEEARVCLEPLLKRSAPNPRSFHLGSRIAARLGDIPGALELIGEAVRLAPQLDDYRAFKVMLEGRAPSPPALPGRST